MSTESDFQAQAAAATAAANKQSVATASIVASAPTAAQAASRLNYYRQFAPPRFPKTMSLDAAAEWSTRALEAYRQYARTGHVSGYGDVSATVKVSASDIASAYGVPVTKEGAKKWTASEIKNIASAYGYEGYIPDEIPTNEKEAGEALVGIASAAAAEELGVDPKLCEVTVEAIIDGKIDKNDCESIGKTAGSIAGAAICQAYGIPAPIGAFLGGEIGGFIGGEVADIFGLSKKAHEKWLAEQRAIVAKELAQAEEQCEKIREGYWAVFDQYVHATEVKWENLELAAGYRFGVRWFGRTPSPNFLQYVQQQAGQYGNRIGSQSCQVICWDGYSLKTTAQPFLASASNADILAMRAACRTHLAPRVAKKFNISQAAANALLGGMPDPTDSCGLDCIADYGCLYPDMTPYTKYPSLDTLGSAKRVCAAYYGLGFPWYPAITPALLRSWGATDFATAGAALTAHAGEYRNIICDLPEASSRAVRDTKYRKLWLNTLHTMLEMENRKIANLNSASVRLLGDLAKTAAIVAVQRKMTDSKTRAALHGLGSDAPLDRTSAWVNNGTLAAGLGFLAYRAARR